MESLLILGGHVLDPATKKDEKADLLLRDGRIARCAPQIREAADRVIDADGYYVCPGLIDMHVHLRDPGQTEKEDLASGTAAAARGGFTSVLAMPNTRPVIDSAGRWEEVHRRAAALSTVRVYQAGTASADQEGRELADISGMTKSGALAISEDGRSVMNAELMRRALAACAEAGVPFLDHCEDADLVNGGVVNLDEFALCEDLPGISNATEDCIIARDILLAASQGAHLHLCHCSTAGSYELVRLAKQRGLSVTAEVCPHHFTLTSGDRVPGDTNYKMNPPLRAFEDRAALRKGLADGTFDVISTDHAPHTAEEKSVSMREAPFGIVGLETAVPLVITELVRPGVLTPLQMVEKMSTNPARILGLTGQGTLAEGTVADVTIIDPAAAYRIDPSSFASKGKNTPFGGRYVHGRVVATIVGGMIQK